jgi:hypothetical protein
LRFRVNKVLADGNLRSDTEFRLQLVEPLWSQQFGTDDKYPRDASAGNQFACYQPGADRFAEADVVRQERDR